MFGITSNIFQFTPLREGRLSRCPRVRASGKFQFTPLREGRHARYVGIAPTAYFNSRPSARGDPVDEFIFQMEVISIHAPPRGATKKLAENLKKVLFQFTPLREGRPEQYCLREELERISIHAPPRGATVPFCVLFSCFLFQFTPLREGRQRSARTPKPLPTFQFTPLREGRHQGTS